MMNPLNSSQPNPDPESDIDKFATLFNPQTPQISRPYSLNQNKRLLFAPVASDLLGRFDKDKDIPALSAPGSADSEFGSFVSLPSTQDPLSESFFPYSPP